jgi:S1-C subfamily serine protease
MKKVFLIVVLIFVSLLMVSCNEPLTYDEIEKQYIKHIESNESDYQFSIDYFNAISTESIKSVVVVTKSTLIGLVGTTSGSGVIIREDLTHYYVLTNHHVIYTNQPRSTIINISDFKGETYRAELLFSNSQFDLAVLKFKKNSNNLSIIDFSLHNASVNEKLSIIGHPNYQINAITLGTVNNYAKVNVTSESSSQGVTFEVLITDAPVMSGSSGSVVLNSNRKLIGIVFAGNFYDNQTISHATFAIPVEKIYEFFDLNNFILGGIIA